MSSSEVDAAEHSGTPPVHPLATLFSLMMPFAGLILVLSGVAVAVPVIREAFEINADTASWLITSYTLTYIAFQPLFGRLGDVVGNRRIYMLGGALLALGTGLGILSRSLDLLLVARAVQGVGAASVNPISMSIIFATFPAERRGRVLATWNTVGPVTGSVGPLLAGFLLERFHWSAIFIVPLLVTGVSIVLLARLVPERHSGPIPWARIRRMDWLGLLLLIGFVTLFVSYLSSRPVTGVDPLRDLRLGLPAAALLVGFVVRERRVRDPFVPLSLLRLGAFTGASLASAARMFLLAGVNFLMPLYVSDVYGLGSAVTGLVVTTNAFALMVTMRIGGHLVDRALSPLPVVFGLLGQAAAMSALALLPSLASPWPIFLCVGVHGLAAGIALGPMHKFALSEAAEGEVGMAAGLYSLIRFIGVLIGAAIGGVVLQAGLDAGVSELVAYRYTFVVYMGVGLGGSLLARLLLRKG